MSRTKIEIVKNKLKLKREQKTKIVNIKDKIKLVDNYIKTFNFKFFDEYKDDIKARQFKRLLYKINNLIELEYNKMIEKTIDFFNEFDELKKSLDIKINAYKIKADKFSRGI